MSAAGIPKSEAKERDALFAALEGAPDDKVTQLALADWFDEHDRPGHAACLRWLAAEGRAPFQYFEKSPIRHHHETWEAGWWWWVTDSEESPWGYPPGCVLPRKLWRRMDHTFTYDPCVFKEYPSVRAAVLELCRAWGRKRRGKKKEKPPGAGG